MRIIKKKKRRQLRFLSYIFRVSLFFILTCYFCYKKKDIFYLFEEINWKLFKTFHIYVYIFFNF